MKEILFKCFIVLFVCTSTFSQQFFAQSYNPKDYKNKPLWIEMMRDPNVNYFETIKAFREFWKDRILPEEPFEDKAGDKFEFEVGLIEANESEFEREREERKRKRKGNQETLLYAADVRAFKGWFYSIKPWVRADGSIVSIEEQQQILDKQRQELNEIEMNNNKK